MQLKAWMKLSSLLESSPNLLTHHSRDTISNNVPIWVAILCVDSSNVRFKVRGSMRKRIRHDYSMLENYEMPKWRNEPAKRGKQKRL